MEKMRRMKDQDADHATRPKEGNRNTQERREGEEGHGERLHNLEPFDAQGACTKLHAKNLGSRNNKGAPERGSV